MNRRLLTTAAATAAIILAPTAAMAYTGDDYDAAAPAVVAEGEPFEVVLEGPVENPSFTLTVESAAVPDAAIEIAGSQTLAKATVNGISEFTVTLHEEAVYELTGVNAAGEVVLESTVTVGDPADDGAGAGAGDDAAGGALPDTGSTSTPLVIGAAALLAAGAGVLVFARRQVQA